MSDSPTFYEDLSVWEHLEYVARMHGHDDWEQHGADLLGHLGLYERAGYVRVPLFGRDVVHDPPAR